MVNFNSTPQTSQRNLMFTFRISPGGGGSGVAIVTARNIVIPTRHKVYINNTPKANQITEPKVTAVMLDPDRQSYPQELGIIPNSST
jgi:hypothetical protein